MRVKNVAGLSEKNLSTGCQAHSARATFKQFGSELIFKKADLAADCRWGNVENFSSPTDRTKSCDFLKVSVARE